MIILPFPNIAIANIFNYYMDMLKYGEMGDNIQRSRMEGRS